MARWNSIPSEDEHVCVTDVDVVMVKNDLDEILELLNEFDLVSISRNKQPKINMMMVNYISKDKCQTVSDFAKSLMDSKDFKWDIDLEVMSHIKKKMSYTYLHRLVKFDSSAGLIPKLFTDTSFGYYSAVSVRFDNVEYEGGYDAKKAKYEWADKNDIINFATKHLFSRQ
jgi:hypothetical protein